MCLGTCGGGCGECSCQRPRLVNPGAGASATCIWAGVTALRDVAGCCADSSRSDEAQQRSASRCVSCEPPSSRSWCSIGQDWPFLQHSIRASGVAAHPAHSPRLPATSTRTRAAAEVRRTRVTLDSMRNNCRVCQRQRRGFVPLRLLTRSSISSRPSLPTSRTVPQQLDRLKN